MAKALTGKTASVDIPKPRGGHAFVGRDSFAAVAARSLPIKNPTHTLPTPPNSISPSLPPRAFKSAGAVLANDASPPGQVDSDIDLHDAVDAEPTSAIAPQHGFAVTTPDAEPAATDAAGAITPGLLAKHHLPDILLAHGPLAIRHVMGYLTTSVPGFSRIPPAKARRLVVGALEGRGSGGEGAGVDENVEFEKVGWGRWDARIKGQPPREGQENRQGALLGDTVSPPPSMPSSYSAVSGSGLPMTTLTRWPDRGSNTRPGTSWAGDSAVFSHDEDMDPAYPEDVTMLEHEADKMSLDGEGSCSSSDAPDGGLGADEELGDVTDDEDWAKIGAAALRQGSLSASTTLRRPNIYTQAPMRALPPHSTSPSMLRGGLYNIQEGLIPSTSSSSGGVIGSDSQEREAIEALVRLSSV
ncbi:MAG: DNA-binding proteins Bright/BRCAA1/RBP1 and proteins containing BRIGHT domain [Thelocarpon superellum]|nr:MAG: DNA-binding proteins Bright/BRCAA1/RBP1 and proteins containing BRIGHT domain [Thelocarpon superellum]